MTQGSTNWRRSKRSPLPLNTLRDLKQVPCQVSVEMFREHTAIGEVNRVLGSFKNCNRKPRTHCSNSMLVSKGLLSPLPTNVNKHTVHINCYIAFTNTIGLVIKLTDSRDAALRHNSEWNSYYLLYILSFLPTFYKSSFFCTPDISHSNASLQCYWLITLLIAGRARIFGIGITPGAAYPTI